MAITLLEVDGTDATVRFKAAGKPEDFQMRIVFDVAHHGLRVDGMRDFRVGELFDGRFSVDHVPAAEILVNLFDGGPKSMLSFRIDDGPELPMVRVVQSRSLHGGVFHPESGYEKILVECVAVFPSLVSGSAG